MVRLLESFRSMRPSPIRSHPSSAGRSFCARSGSTTSTLPTSSARIQRRCCGCRRFQRPYDLRILGRVESAHLNLLHVCGEGVLFDEFADYPATALSWATVPGNPSLSEGHRRTGRAVVGGLPAKPVIKALPPTEVEARGRRAIAEMNGRFLLLGPDCSIDPDTPEAVMDAATAGPR